jgi:NADH-quinone oxidoreductase subunit F
MCERGPNVVIYPEGVYYCNVSPLDVHEIVEEHLYKGCLVERLLYTSPELMQKIVYYKDLPFYNRQHRIILRNCGFIDPENIEEYIACDGYQALAKALLSMTPDGVIEEVKRSGLRGRGGAGFPTGLKWSFTKKARGEPKYIICNADEGDPGAFMDRSLLEGDPHSLIEGMLIAGYAIGAKEGYVYCRAEYPLAIRRLKIAIAQAEEYGLLGDDILGTNYSFRIKLKEGAGAFVCGEETALIASIEGRRGEPRPRPPFPANSGLWGKPTNINNVKSYASVPQIVLNGADWFSSIGATRSPGTAVFALTGKVKNTGLVEIPMGTPLGNIIFDIGGGIAKDRKFKAVQTGGPLGGCIPVQMLNLPVDFDSLTAAGALMGSGGMIVVDENTCMVELARFFLQFAVAESCGQCPPCRVGGQKLLEILTRLTQGAGKAEDLAVIEDIAGVMKEGSLCALGQGTPNPVLTALRYFRDEFEAHITDKRCPAGACTALAPSPCRSGCPAEVNIPEYLSLIADGKYDEALAVHRQSNPFPSVCGRVCPAFCEDKCRRGEVDDPVAVRDLKRFMADHESAPWTPEQLESDKSESVAIIGGGPGGLTAALRLAQLGYRCTIYEALPRLGGMMRYGIPDYRLPKSVLDNEIGSILRVGKVEIKTNTALGRDVTLSGLLKEHAAVLLAIGAQGSHRLDIPGEELEGVMHGVELLRRLNSGEDMSFVKGKRVAVVGGGNVAMDAARSLLRLGAAEVHVVYRRERRDMPALTEEIEAAEEEGIHFHLATRRWRRRMISAEEERAKFHFLAAPTEIMGAEGKVTGLKCQRLSLTDAHGKAEFDSSARKRPVPVEGSYFTLHVDIIVPAVGQTIDMPLLREEGINQNRDGTISVQRRTFLTSREGVFAIGDAVIGPASVVEAVSQGNKVSKAIHRYLRGMGSLRAGAVLGSA